MPGVEDIAIVGLPDPVRGEIACAAVVPSDRVPTWSLDQIRSHLAGISGFKHPRLIREVR